MDKLSNVDETEKSDQKEKRKAELFERERQERLSKLDEWKVNILMLFFKDISSLRSKIFCGQTQVIRECRKHSRLTCIFHNSSALLSDVSDDN